jgi:hypothetical protein
MRLYALEGSGVTGRKKPLAARQRRFRSSAPRQLAVQGRLLMEQMRILMLSVRFVALAAS